MYPIKHCVKLCLILSWVLLHYVRELWKVRALFLAWSKSEKREEVLRFSHQDYVFLVHSTSQVTCVVTVSQTIDLRPSSSPLGILPLFRQSMKR